MKEDSSSMSSCIEYRQIWSYSPFCSNYRTRACLSMSHFDFHFWSHARLLSFLVSYCYRRQPFDYSFQMRSCFSQFAWMSVLFSISSYQFFSIASLRACCRISLLRRYFFSSFINYLLGFFTLEAPVETGCYFFVDIEPFVWHFVCQYSLPFSSFSLDRDKLAYAFCRTSNDYFFYRQALRVESVLILAPIFSQTYLQRSRSSDSFLIFSQRLSSLRSSENLCSLVSRVTSLKSSYFLSRLTTVAKDSSLSCKYFLSSIMLVSKSKIRSLQNFFSSALSCCSIRSSAFEFMYSSQYFCSFACRRVFSSFILRMHKLWEPSAIADRDSLLSISDSCRSLMQSSRLLFSASRNLILLFWVMLAMKSSSLLLTTGSTFIELWLNIYRQYRQLQNEPPCQHAHCAAPAGLSWAPPFMVIKSTTPPIISGHFYHNQQVYVFREEALLRFLGDCFLLLVQVENPRLRLAQLRVDLLVMILGLQVVDSHNPLVLATAGHNHQLLPIPLILHATDRSPQLLATLNIPEHQYHSAMLGNFGSSDELARLGGFHMRH